MPNNFVHLRAHTEYSISHGLLRIKPWIQAVKAAGMPAVAMTDRYNLFGLVQFYCEAIKQGIKPIIGADIALHNDKEPAKPFSITLLCQNNQGYQHLIQLLSKAYLEGQQHDTPIVQHTWLAECAEGLIALSGAMSGDVGQALLSEQHDELRERLAFWQQYFPDRYYIELQRIGLPQEAIYLQKATQLAAKNTLPVVATNSVEFLTQDDYEAHEARVCIHEGWQLADPKRPHRFTDKQFLRSPDTMQTLFADIPSALQNTVEIAKRCTVDLTLGKTFLPDFPVPVGMSIEGFLTQEAEKGLAKFFDVNTTDIALKKQTYKERLKIELDVINRMGFAGYFLIVADFIRWAKENDVPVGPGRGSGAGSLVAFVLGITNLDPLHHELLFERFLNPERVSMPDFDIDFCMEGRDRVIDYVAQKYGRDSVSQIITFGTMAAKAVVRDVGRILGFSYGYVDKIAKLIPFELGMTLTKALDDEEALRERYENEEDVTTLIDLALKLEGITRNAGKHAGGVVIAPTKLTDFTPLYCESGSSQLVTQFHKDDVESVGLVKFDFLGLRTLTIIDWALKTVNEQQLKAGLEPIDINAIPMDDAATYDLLKSCQTTAVFQLESRGMKDLIKRLQPDAFEEIVALVALFRPGPLQSGMVDDFIDRKHGRAKVTYAHPDLEPILCTTYGVILYQEQVMKIAQVLAGYSLGKADILRRAMGKKKVEEMAEQRKFFVEGALQRGVDEKTATYVFDLMEKFAGYGFNKSHSAAYALLSYQTAWLKTHYPAAFMAAVLSSDMDNTDKVVIFVEDCRQMSLNILLPNINEGQYKFTVNDQGELIYGLGAVKGAGEAALSLIIAEREAHGPFKNLFDFCARLDLRKVNKRVLEALVKSGAMDVFGVERATLFASLDKAVQAADQHARNQASGQHDLFAMENDPLPVKVDYVNVKPWREDERLIAEKESLGLYLTGHPIKRYLPELKAFTQGPIAHLRPRHNQNVLVAGLVVGLKTMQTKRGDRMAFVTLDDSTARIEMAAFPEVYQTYKNLLVKDQLLVVEGEVSVDEYTGGYKLSCHRLYDIAGAREIFAKVLSLRFTQAQMEAGAVTQLEALLRPFCGGACPVQIHYEQPHATATLTLGHHWRVTPQDELLNALRDQFLDDAVELEYA